MLTLLKNCLLTSYQKVNILIENNKIAKIYPNKTIINHHLGQKIDAVFDIKNNLVFPGIVDMFSRIINPSAFSKSDYHSETIACAYGGITTFVDVPVVPIFEDYHRVIKKKMEQAKEKSLVNYAFVVNACDFSNLKELKKIQNNTVGTIVHLNATNLQKRIFNVEFLNEILACSKLVYLHLSGLDIDMFFSYCQNKNTKLIFYDVTNEWDLKKILTYKKEGFNVKIATAISYLLFNQEMLNTEYKKKTLTVEYKLGNMLNNIHLWNGIKNHQIDIITSDHLPVTILEKFETQQKGLPHFETLFSVLFDNFWYKKLPIGILEDLLAVNPAKICGFKNKGAIKEGYDADLLVINTTKRWWIKNEDIISQARWTPFHNYRISGRIMMTFVNGHLLYNYINQMCPIRKIKPGKLAVLN